ncbi:MAG: N-acetyltransferase [Gemmatimonadota bacterium]|nr:N-acetyltransferase [Gemmatimonadota bacterium]
MTPNSRDVLHNPEASRYELQVDGHTAFADYQERAGSLAFTHTEVPADIQGRGIGSALIRGALDDTQRRGVRVAPVCPFVADFVRNHPEYHHLLSVEDRKTLGIG